MLHALRPNAVHAKVLFCDPSRLHLLWLPCFALERAFPFRHSRSARARLRAQWTAEWQHQASQGCPGMSIFVVTNGGGLTASKVNRLPDLSLHQSAKAPRTLHRADLSMCPAFTCNAISAGSLTALRKPNVPAGKLLDNDNRLNFESGTPLVRRTTHGPETPAIKRPPRLPKHSTHGIRLIIADAILILTRLAQANPAFKPTLEKYELYQK